jgi:hypothetical protein
MYIRNQPKTMEILKIEDFIKQFHKKNENMTFTEFKTNGKVKIGEKMRPLKEYVLEKKIENQDLKLLFENIKTRDEYLTRFYNLSLRIQPDKIHINIPPMKRNHMNNNHETMFKNIIRNIHYKGILLETESGIENNPTYMKMLLDLYLRNIIDYKLLTPSAIFYMKNGRLGSVFSSYYFRASIMNPYLVYSLNKSILHGTRIFTPTLGWSSYCYGFLECPEVVEYVGTDVIQDVCSKTEQLCKSHINRVKYEIFCKPSEDLLNTKSFIDKYKNHFDVVFFSPPYYKLELYKGGKQSTDRYNTYEEWLENYWLATIQLCHRVLEKGGRLCYILSDYGSINTKNQFELLSDMNNITKKYFHLKNIQPMFNKNVNVTSHRDTNEKIMIFEKK